MSPPRLQCEWYVLTRLNGIWLRPFCASSRFLGGGERFAFLALILNIAESLGVLTWRKPPQMKCQIIINSSIVVKSVNPAVHFLVVMVRFFVPWVTPDLFTAATRLILTESILILIPHVESNHWFNVLILKHKIPDIHLYEALVKINTGILLLTGIVV